MSISLLARELYKTMQSLEKLERQLEAAPKDKRPFIIDQLRRVRAERDQMRRVLDGQIDR